MHSSLGEASLLHCIRGVELDVPIEIFPGIFSLVRSRSLGHFSVFYFRTAAFFWTIAYSSSSLSLDFELLPALVNFGLEQVASNP